MTTFWRWLLSWVPVIGPREPKEQVYAFQEFTGINDERKKQKDLARVDNRTLFAGLDLPRRNSGDK